jgi:hypothetical protein
MLEIKADGKDIEALSMLKLASATIKLLRAIEKDMSGKRPSIQWRINILSGGDYGMIQIFATGSAENILEGEITARKAMAALHEVEK